MISHTMAHCCCGNLLTGKQTKFCSSSCKTKGQSNAVYSNQQLRGKIRKQKLVDLKGGSCSHCGYNKSLAALQFHHVDPSTKKHQLDLRSLSNRSWKAILQEADKCILLCANCHAEHHYST
jgi:hypothetical protein